MENIGVDPTFEVNAFGLQKFKSESQTLADSVVSLLFSKPGSFPSMPELGINIQRYLYSFWDDVDENAIKVQLSAQCATLSPLIRNGDIQVIKSSIEGNPLLLIVIPLDIDESKEHLAIGITQDSNGNTQYNYVFE